MPYPLTPAGQINSYDNLFPNYSREDEVSLANRRFVQESNSDHLVNLLEKIDKHQDGVVNAAIESVSGKNEDKYYNVPESIGDDMLLKLKTAGLCLGSGRLVKFTDRAKNLLKAKYLGGQNLFKSQRVKKKII